ncbi:MAG: lectin-like protein [Myxococcota bacterium]
MLRSALILSIMACGAAGAACGDDAAGGTSDSTADATSDSGTDVAPDSGPDSTVLDSSVNTDATVATDATAPDTSVEDTTVADTSVADTAVDDTSVDDTTVADTTVEDTTVADTTVEDTTVADTTVEDTGTVEDTSVDPCVGHECGDHGACMPVGATPLCVCFPGYSGGACESCDTDYVDVHGDGVCTKSICGDGYVDAAKEEDCDPGGAGTGLFCLACKLDCAAPSADSNATLMSTGCYITFQNNETWAGAQAGCDDLGLHLWSVGTAREGEAVRSAIRYDSWLGLSGTQADGIDGFWEGGEPVDYTQSFAATTADPYCLYSAYANWSALDCDTAARPYICELTTCGDHRIESNEQCDDGNYVNGDGCDEDCTKTGCGNGIISQGEDCDDGNTDGSDDCPADCRFPCAHGSSADKVVQTSAGCYALHRTGTAFADAEAICEADGQQLTKVISRGEDDVIADLIGTDLAWIGLSDADTEGSFLWRDGSAPSYTRWAGIEPNNGGSPGSNEDCTQLYADNGHWNDAGCDGRYAFVCGTITCGNGVLDGGEECDPSVGPTPGCAANCSFVGCGNRVVEAGETCDDGNDVGGDGCEPDCHLPCDDTSGADRAWLAASGACYSLYESDLDWADSEARCAAAGGHLASIGDAAEAAVIAGLGLSEVFIGLSDAAVEGTWTWSSGEAYSYTHWAGGEPNDAGGNEDCGALRKDGLWNDVNCAGLAPALCESPN